MPLILDAGAIGLLDEEACTAVWLSTLVKVKLFESDCPKTRCSTLGDKLGKVTCFTLKVSTASRKDFGLNLVDTIFCLTKSVSISFVKKLFLKSFLLKKYLRKFKHNYRNYFFYKNGNFNNVPTEKEMNTSAIKYLFLLTGI